MNITLQWIDVVLFIGICQGIFLSLTLQRISHNNRSANRILSYLIALATVMLMGRFVYFRFLTLWVFQWSLLVDAIVFLFGPFTYMYIKRLLFKGNSSFWLPKIHFVPFFGMALMALLFIIKDTPETYYQYFLHGNLLLYFKVISALMILFNTYYVVKSFQLVSAFKKTEKEVFSFRQTPVTYLRFFLVSVFICLLAWTCSEVNSVLFQNSLPYVSYDSIWVAIPVFIYVIGYFSLKQPELFSIVEEKQKDLQKKERIPETEALLLQKKLDSLMHNEKVFLQNDLTLADVADRLQTSTNNLSWLLNQVYKTTFYDFINAHRVQEFIKKVENQEHLKHTILALSMDVGFNSKSTFNKAFKETMRDTPSNYIKKHRAA
ncbi:MAG: AraC family transcriptional regulator [Flavobacteriaceae bacterium]